MLITNKSNTVFRQGKLILYPYQTEDVPEDFLNHPVILSALNCGQIERVGEDQKVKEAPVVTVSIPEEPEEEPVKVEEAPKKRKKAE